VNSHTARAAVAEGLGTLILVATVVGSGVMAERLAGGNDAVALIGNTGATAAMLYLLITLFGPISGAQFNPAVTLILTPRKQWAVYIAAQVAGGVLGTWLVHAMFAMPILEVGAKVRAGPHQWLGEFVATFGLLLTIILASSKRPQAVAGLVACWITAGYWFTSSTSFANPAVTIARALTDSFAGIRPVDAPGFIVAQMAGALVGAALGKWLVSAGEHYK
jgi:glycerol uptake facilitator-like aquaporin